MSTQQSSSSSDTPQLSPRKDTIARIKIDTAAGTSTGEINVVSPTACTPTRSHSKNKNSGNNSNQVNGDYPYSSLSPKVQVPLSYIIERTQSSPCILDASPKNEQFKHQHRQQQEYYNIQYDPMSPSKVADDAHVKEGNNIQYLYHSSQLTPVARNTTRGGTSGVVGGDVASSKMATRDLSVPNALGNKPSPPKSRPSSESASSSGLIMNQPSIHNMSKDSQSKQYTIIRPRNVSSIWTTIGTATKTNKSAAYQSADSHNRPISPPSWSSYRATTFHEPSKTAASKEVNARFESPPNRFSSPVRHDSVKLDRNYYSLPHPKQMHQQQQLMSSPESMVGSPQPRSPPADDDSSMLFVPYQPSRKSSLTSFGFVQDDELDDIFLPLRTTNNKFRRSSKDKVVFVGGGGDCDNVVRESLIHEDGNGAVFGETIPEDDAMTYLSDSQSSLISIPSIHMGVRINSSTQDSMTTVEGVEEEVEEDDVFDDDHNISSCASFDEQRESSILYNSGLDFKTNSNDQNKKRYKSSKKEKQVYEWLRTLEVDKDNNEYFAEAASSKFLTGKMNVSNKNNHEIFADCPPIEQFISALNEEMEILDMDCDNLEGHEGQMLDQGTVNEQETKKAIPSKASSSNIIMGRNLSVYDRYNKNGKGTSAVKISGLYR